jgi:hypothetical protein
MNAQRSFLTNEMAGKGLLPFRKTPKETKG